MGMVVKVFNLYQQNNPKKLFTGSIEGIRIYMKNYWKVSELTIKETLGYLIEEDYYKSLDVDILLFLHLNSLGFFCIEICEIPMEDFSN